MCALKSLTAPLLAGGPASVGTRLGTGAAGNRRAILSGDIDPPAVLASRIRLFLVTERSPLLWPFGQAGLLSSLECCAICMSVREPIQQGRMRMG
jgi:hypothetical protein